MSAHWVSTQKKKELEKLGFTFIKTKDYRPEDWYSEGCKKLIKFNTIEELVAFSRNWGSIIISGDSIEIYNDYRE